MVQDAENNDATMSEIHAIVQAYQDQQASEMNEAMRNLAKVLIVGNELRFLLCRYLGS